jgi:hypothetical protein
VALRAKVMSIVPTYIFYAMISSYGARLDEVDTAFSALCRRVKGESPLCRLDSSSQICIYSKGDVKQIQRH